MKALKIGLYNKFVGSALASNVSNRFFDSFVPEGTPFPYIRYSFPGITPEKTFTEEYENVQIQFSLFSDDIGDGTEIETMFENLVALYDDCEITATGHSVIYMQRQSSDEFVEEHTTTEGTKAVWHAPVLYELLSLRTT